MKYVLSGARQTRSRYTVCRTILEYRHEDANKAEGEGGAALNEARKPGIATAHKP